MRKNGDLTVFTIAAVRHLVFWKFNFLTAWTVERPILHNLLNFAKIGQSVAVISRFLVIFKMLPPSWIFTIRHLTAWPCRGPICFIVPNFIKIGQTVAEIWRFNRFQTGGRPPSWICEIRMFSRSERLRDPFCISIPNFVKSGQTVTEISRFSWFFKMTAAAILDFQKFEILTIDPL